MRRIVTLLFMAGCLMAQSGLDAPVIGHYRDDSGRLIRLQGVPGALSVLEEQDQEIPESVAEGWQILREEGKPPMLVRQWTGERFELPMAEGALKLYVRVSSDREQATGEAFDFPQTAVGETSEVRFRVRNTGTAGVTVTRLALSGAGFSIFDEFSPPRIIAPGQAADFSVRYQPQSAGPHTARLQINDQIYELRGNSQAQARVEVQLGGDWVALSPYASRELGSVEQGKRLETFLRVVVPDGVPVGPNMPSISGPGFRLAVSGTDYAIWFEPQTPGAHEAVLTVGSRSFPVTATALEAAPPRPVLSYRSAAMESGRQEFVSVRLTELPKSPATGLLRMEFIPALPDLGDDTLVVFLPARNRSASFTVAPGSLDAIFAGSPQLTLQTGSTAGTIVLRLTLGTHSEEVRISVAGAPVQMSSARATRGSNILEVTLAGIDNTRTVSKVSFRFFLTNGAAIGEPISVDVANAFHAYYAGNPMAGGTFSLRASFLVSGPIETLDGVEASVLNKDGTISTGRLRF